MPSADSKRIETQMSGARNYFNIDLLDTGIYLINSDNPEYCELFEFASSPSTNSLIHHYLNNIDILKYFTLFFKDSAKDLIKKSDKFRIQPQNLIEIKPSKNNKNINQINYANFFHAATLKNLPINKGPIQTRLTKREFECLNYLMAGYTLKEIGKSLNLSPRSIEEYLDNTKSKLHAHNKSSLIKKTFQLQLFNGAYLNWLISKNNH